MSERPQLRIEHGDGVPYEVRYDKELGVFFVEFPQGKRHHEFPVDIVEAMYEAGIVASTRLFDTSPRFTVISEDGKGGVQEKPWQSRISGRYVFEISLREIPLTPDELEVVTARIKAAIDSYLRKK